MPENDAHYQQFLDSRSRYQANSFHQAYLPHPYFGFQLDPAMETADEKINNYGFLDEHDFPFKASPNQYVVGIFGGSLAAHFATAIQGPLKKYFIEKLKEARPALAAKEIVILSMAHGGSKQPQQFFTFAYFSQMFDLTLNIEGLNDTLLSPNGKFPLDYPVMSQFFYTHSSEGKKLLRKLEEVRDIEKSVVSFFYQHQFIASLNTVQVLLPRLQHLLAQRYLKTMDQFFTHQSIYDRPRSFEHDHLQDESVRIKVKAEIWQKYVRFQANLAKLEGVRALFFLQPNQYIEGSKPIGKEEAKIAWVDAASRFRMTKKAYAHLESAVGAMAKEGLEVFSLVQAFQREKRQVYIDGCCHINNLGNEILIDYMMKRLRREKRD